MDADMQAGIAAMVNSLNLTTGRFTIEAEPAEAQAFVERAVEKLNEQLAAGEVPPGTASEAAVACMQAEIIADAQEDHLTGDTAAAALCPAGERLVHWVTCIQPYAEAVQLLKQKIEAAGPPAADMPQLQEVLAAWKDALGMVRAEAEARNYAHAMQYGD